ncbi:MAG: type II toxin-antitoxin system prevent-host-death family antitoxin [Treponema sp.]|nr:type II toxin-antitoxin system prevent-host-death family antitoxin [Treponema sp.]
MKNTVNTISIHEAKTNFSKLVKRAEAGETIYIGAYGKPTVALEAVDQRDIRAKNRAAAFGCMKDIIPDGFEIKWTDDELYEMFYSFMTREEFDKL